MRSPPTPFAFAGLLVAVLACDGEPPPGEPATRAEVASILDTYIHGLELGDPTRVALAPDVRFESPATREAGKPIQGEAEVREFYEDTGRGIRSIDVERHLIDGSHACTLLEWESSEGREIPAVHCFEIEDRTIARIRIFSDAGFLEGGVLEAGVLEEGPLGTGFLPGGAPGADPPDQGGAPEGPLGTK